MLSQSIQTLFINHLNCTQQMDQSVNLLWFLKDAHTNATNKAFSLRAPNTSPKNVAKKPIFSPFPNLNPDPTMIGK